MIDIDFMSKKYQELKESTEIVIVLKSEDYPKFDITIFNTTYKDAIAFQVIYNNEPLIFIKKIKYLKKFNYRESNRVADRAFTIHDTTNAIKSYEILLLTKKPGIHVYGRLGLLYLSQNNIYNALIYLKIATAMSQSTKRNKYNFTSLINKITSSIEEKDKDYCIQKIKDVSILMHYEGMSIQEACQALNIGEEEKQMISLLLAREYYAINDLKMGDKYLILVEKAPNKSQKVKSLLEEIRINRLFYQNRVTEDYKPLILSRTLSK